MAASSSSIRSRVARCIRWLLSIGMLCVSPLEAHDFWVQPDTFRTTPGASTSFTLQVGHGPLRQLSPIPAKRISRFEAIGPDGSAVDLSAGLPGRDPVSFAAAGVYTLVLETDDRAQSHLPAIRFNDYLKAEGLTSALDHRALTHRSESAGSERYSRRAKSIIQVGASTAAQSNVTEPVGLPLEIVPERNPYAEPRLSALPIRVLYKGQPLAGALVKLTNLEQDDVPFETHVTDRAGHAVFTLPATGIWLLNVIWTTPLPDSSEVDFETVFSSLTFGFQ